MRDEVGGAGVVHEHVEPAKSVDGGGDHHLDHCLIRDVGSMCERLTS